MRDSNNWVSTERPGAVQSSKHALFETTAAGLQVEDLRSTNGTQVNGADISGARVLHPGDRVEVGDTVFQVEVR